VATRPDELVIPKEEPAPEPPAPPAEETPPEPKPEGRKSTPRTFSEDDIAKARREEKDKLYPRLEQMENEVKTLREEREARIKAEKEREAQLAAEAKKRAEEEMSLKELLTQKESEWEARLRAVEEQRQRDQALLDQERRFHELQQFRARRLQEEEEAIMPELRDLLTGNTEEEIEASLNSLKERTQRILEQVSGNQQVQRTAMKGASVTAPPMGPLENQPGYETLSPDDIRNMDMATYTKMRDKLLGAVQQQVRGSGPYG
jgi:hypothetical protein